MKKKWSTPQIILIVFFVIACLALFSTTLGRYVYNAISNHLLESQGFYFNSTVLNQDGAVYRMNNWDGVNDYSLSIDVNNYKNDQVYTKSDIQYEIKVECSDNVECSLNKQSGIIYEEAKTDSYRITITPTKDFDTNDEVVVTTSAKSTSPYQKTLSATYHIGIEIFKFSYEIEDSVGSKFLTLKLTNSVSYYEVLEDFSIYHKGDNISLEVYNRLSEEDKKKCFSAKVKLDFPADRILLDMTNNTYLNRIENSTVETVIDRYRYIEGYQFYVGATSNTEIIFYKKDIDQDYSYPSGNTSSIIDVEVVTAT